MQVNRNVLATLLVTGLMAASPRLAVAAEPSTLAHPQLSGEVLYGFDRSDYAPSPFGVGVRLRGGHTLSMGLYAGGLVEYFFEDSGTRSAAGVTAEVHNKAYEVMAELGYDFLLGTDLAFRPRCGFGTATVVSRTCVTGNCNGDSDTGFAVAPGMTAIYPVGPIFVAADFSYMVAFANESVQAVEVGGGAGFTF